MAEAQAEAAEPTSEVAVSGVAALVGRNIERIEVVFDEPLWSTHVRLTGVHVGQTFTPSVARRALSELGATGRFGELRAEVEPLGSGVLLRLLVVARRVIASVRVTGVGDADDLLRAANIRAGSEVTARELPLMQQRLKEELARRGYPDASVRAELFDADDPLEIVLGFEVSLGPPARISERRFFVWPDPGAPRLATLLAKHRVGRGDAANLEALETESRELEQRLRAAGYFEARVEHALSRLRTGHRLDVRVYAGAFIKVSFEGNRRFDASELMVALELEEAADRSASALAERIREFYVRRGFYDAEVEPMLHGAADAALRALVFRIREGEPLRVIAREFPCLSGERSADAVGSEIDSFLSELPGGTLVDAVDAASVTALFGPRHTTGHRPRPLFLNPWSVYSPEVYERALEHVSDLYRSEGYLSASVGPVTLLRRSCDVRSMPGQCIPKTPHVRPLLQCQYDAAGLPLEEPPSDPALFCREDPERGVYCESEVVLSIPVKLGPRSFIDSIVFEGNRILPEAVLQAAAALSLGTPVSQMELDRARRSLLDVYAEEGFAFAEVEVERVLSSDHRRAKVVFVISERKQVRISRIVIQGARMTRESVIRRRIALEAGGLYRHSLVRTTEERLATLGVFSSITVGFEDPYVPASEKVVVVTVQEKKPQYLDVRPGFSTGEGFRISFEYGHRNLSGRAIQLTLRSQLGFLPSALILEDSVRSKYEELGTLERLERRNTATVEFPDVGLGPLFRFRVEGIDVRDNARDYGLTKDAGIVSLFFLPERRLWFELGGSLERNDARIFGQGQKCALDRYIRENPAERATFRVPEGPTMVVAQRFGATWDRRDRPLDATSGTFFSAGVEHAVARPLDEVGSRCFEDQPDDFVSVLRGTTSQFVRYQSDDFVSVFRATDSQFLRYTNRVAGYVRLSKRGLALAASFRWGVIQQLDTASRTYPDRLFFLGGVDSLRGFLQDALVPEDFSERLLDQPSLQVDQIVIRGGDFFVNPRMELRVPLTDSVQTAVFVDAGNLWTDPRYAQFHRLRYSVGTGLRVATPVGPLVFDYGFNADRVLDALDPSRTRQRYWEDIGAFHFSIGLF